MCRMAQFAQSLVWTIRGILTVVLIFSGTER